MTDDAVHRALLEPARLEAVRRVGAGPEPDVAFDRFAVIVQRLIDAPIAQVCVVGADRQYFPGQIGVPEPYGAKREMPLTHSFSKHVVLAGAAVVVPDTLADPAVRDNPSVSELGIRSYLLVPLTDADGRTLGSLGALDVEARTWTPSEIALVNDLAAVCSSELRLRIARAAADDARRAAETANDRLSMLAGLTETLAGTFDIDEALERVAAAVVPRLSDWSNVSLLDNDGGIRRVAHAHHDPAREVDLHRFAELLVDRMRQSPRLRQVLRSGRPLHERDLTQSDLRASQMGEAAARDGGEWAEVLELAGRLGYESALTAPITAPVSGRVLGSISLVNGPGRPEFTEADSAVLMDIGRRAGLALDNSRLYRQQRHVAEVLQHSMLTELPEIAGTELHARYLPAQAGAAVGGDWYDAFEQPDGSVLVAVGDVSGHDIEAAATMGQLRNLVRGDAYGRSEVPGALLAQLDRALHGLRVDATATAVLMRLRREDSGYALDFANAGHPPPLVVRPDGTVEAWWVPPEPLLGLLPATKRTTHQRIVEPGSTLLLYTDGLVEDRTRLIDEGVDELIELMRGKETMPAEELCALLVNAAPRRTDDIALLLIRVG